MPLHEWEYDLDLRPELISDKNGILTYKTPEPTADITTWIFEEDSFIPIAKLQNGERFSIFADHLGTPVMAVDGAGEKVWSRELDIYGKTKEETGQSNFIPFLYQGQYFDEEIGLAYNRFRYYDCDSGTYISQDPIGLDGGENFYAYVPDVNSWIDPFGLNELYALLATKDGWYPVMQWGEKKSIGEVFLREGDLWKIGTSVDASKRYSKTYLHNIGEGVELRVLHTNISRKTTLFLENLKLRGYLSWKGHLPPGNKCCH